MKTAVSIPDVIFADADRLAKELGLSRSALYSKALRELIERRRSEAITAAINAALEGETEDEAAEEAAIVAASNRTVVEELEPDR
jgi:metal-responsive CopG/Arc/MetJ family transcriptional regulator